MLHLAALAATRRRLAQAYPQLRIIIALSCGAKGADINDLCGVRLAADALTPGPSPTGRGGTPALRGAWRGRSSGAYGVPRAAAGRWWQQPMGQASGKPTRRGRKRKRARHGCRARLTYPYQHCTFIQRCYFTITLVLPKTFFIYRTTGAAALPQHGAQPLPALAGTAACYHAALLPATGSPALRPTLAAPVVTRPCASAALPFRVAWRLHS